MKIVIRQNFVRGPCDGQTTHRCYDHAELDFATDARPPCVFAADGTPKWCAWYAADFDDVIVAGFLCEGAQPK